MGIRWAAGSRLGFFAFLILSVYLYVVVQNSPKLASARKDSIRKPIFLSKQRPKPRPVMSENYLEAIKARRSIYKISNESPISDDKIQEIVADALKFSPTSFNSQSSRAVILLKDDHNALWALGDAALKAAMPEAAYERLAPKVAGFRRGYGTVLFFEDQATIDASHKRNPGLPHDQWSEHSSGMLQFNVWTMFELEGFGCNLQHYNFMPSFKNDVLHKWKLPETWVLKSQLVFGLPVGGPDHEKTFLPTEEKLRIFGA